MSVLYVGIDEAGYGPMLGPLVVAMSAFKIDSDDESGHAPDLWQELRRAVARELRDAAGRIAVADSKKLKLANSSKTKHPLTHIERGVLAFLRTRGIMCSTDQELHAAVGVELGSAPWYAGNPVHLPLGIDRATLGIDAASLTGAMKSARVELVGVRCIALHEVDFNNALLNQRSKAAVSASLVARLMSEAIERWAGGVDHVRLAIDRQSGRSRYESLLAQMAPSPTISRSIVVPSASRYAIALPSAPGVDATVSFEVEAESRHLPVALASMSAKFVRELAMARFNRFWCSRMPELKPTAGYVTDARRWLRDVEAVITPADREAMVRRA